MGHLYMPFSPSLSFTPLCLVYYCRKMPGCESDHLTPATRLLEKRREMTEVEQALVTQKEVRGGA